MKSSFPNPNPKESAIDRQGRQLTNLVSSMLLFAIGLTLGTIAVLWSLSDLTGEYTCVSPRLGMVRLSLYRKREILKGELVYANISKLDLVACGSVRQDDVNLSFGTLQEFPHGALRRVNLIGKFENGAIFGVLVDSGTPYPVNLRRNVIYSLLKRVSYIWNG